MSKLLVCLLDVMLFISRLPSECNTKALLTVPTVTPDAREPLVEAGEQQEDRGLAWFAMADHFPALPLQRWVLARLEGPEDLTSTGAVQAGQADQ